MFKFSSKTFKLVTNLVIIILFFVLAGIAITMKDRNNTSVIKKVEVRDERVLPEDERAFNNFVYLRDQGLSLSDMTNEQLHAMAQMSARIVDKRVNCLFDTRPSFGQNGGTGYSLRDLATLPLLYEKKINAVVDIDTSTTTILKVCVISNVSPHLSTGGDYSPNRFSENNSLAVISFSDKYQYRLTVISLNLSEKETKVYPLEFKNNSEYTIIFSDRHTIYFAAKDYDISCWGGEMDCSDDAEKVNAAKDFDKPFSVYSLDRATGKMKSIRI